MKKCIFKPEIFAKFQLLRHKFYQHLVPNTLLSGQNKKKSSGDPTFEFWSAHTHPIFFFNYLYVCLFVLLKMNLMGRMILRDIRFQYFEVIRL